MEILLNAQCVVLSPVTSDPEADDETAPTKALTTSRRASRGKYKLEAMVSYASQFISLSTMEYQP